MLASAPKFRAQDGLNHCVEKLKNAIAKFEDAAVVSEARYVHTSGSIQSGISHASKGDIARDVELFIQNCRCMSLGTLLWR